MKINADQRASFEKDGVLLFPRLFDREETAAMARTTRELVRPSDVRCVLEKDSVTVRSLWAPHQMSDAIHAVAHCRRLLGVARQLLGRDTYIFQSRYNHKAALKGDVWEWHQDFTFWAREDGVRRDTMLSAMVFLDEVTEHNGPLLVMPGSHRHQALAPADDVGEPVPAGGPSWLNTHSASLKYKIPSDLLRLVADECGIRSLTGPPGTTCFFHSNIVHGSTVNITPYRRATLFVTYNTVDNSPEAGSGRRPDYIAASSDRPAVLRGDDEMQAALGLEALVD
jgi:ectoine hydroxylase